MRSGEVWSISLVSYAKYRRFKSLPPQPINISKIMTFKNRILDLREKGYSYEEISKELVCSKSTVSYHCKRHGLSHIGLRNNKKLNFDVISQVLEYYKSHTAIETADKFSISVSSIKKYSKYMKKRVFIDDKERKKRSYIRVKTRRQKLKAMAVEYKGGKCEKCGYDKCIWAFDFHHINSTEKDFNISKYATLSWDKLKIELNKCIMICANCHRELHYDENELREFNKINKLDN